MIETVERILIDDMDAIGVEKKVQGRANREERRRQEVGAALADQEIADALSQIPHWADWRARQGETMLDWAKYRMGDGTKSGVKEVENMLKGRGLI